MKKIVFDLDGTICEHCFGDYENAVPKTDVIDRMKQLREDGWHITIATARHMLTCGGNVDLVKARIGNVTVEWLKKHKVPFDELQFGKPFAEWYVDDKAMTVTDFIKGKNI